MIQIQYLGRFLDMSDDEVTYTIQVQDLADISSVSSSFTTSFNIPFTSTNYEAFHSLSLKSDTSRQPYLKRDAKLYDKGAILINNGWLKFINTDDEGYNINIENGIIDFFKAIEGKNLGSDVDISETQHNKDLVSVIDSFGRTDYTYIIADYNGLNTYRANNEEHINVDYLVPSLNNKYLWDKVFETFNYTYSGSVFSTEEFKDLWITYPKAPPTKEDDEEFPEPIQRLHSFKESNVSFDVNFNDFKVDLNLENVTTNGVDLANREITIQHTGSYDFNLNFEGHAEYPELDLYDIPLGTAQREKLRLVVRINGIDTNYGFQNRIGLSLREGDKLSFYFTFPDLMGNGKFHPVGDADKVVIEFYDFKLSQVSQSVIDFSKEFIDISVSEFIKENMLRFSLTPFIDTENKHIEFLTIEERLTGSGIVDWTDKYIGRKNEMYTYKDYAQFNWLRHRYNDENTTFNDGAISVDNKNLEEEKDLYKSKFYSFNREITEFYSQDFRNNSFPIWNREVKEEVNNDTNERTYVVDYKGLAGRYYFIRYKTLNKPTRLGSSLLRVQNVANSVQVVDTNQLTYSEAIDKYEAFSKVMNDTRIHEIELNLNISDLINLDLKKIYFFEQENQYYLLNRVVVNLKAGKSTGEFIRVKR